MPPRDNLMGVVSVAHSNQYPYPGQFREFLNEHESLRPERQLPQFHPRVSWPHPAITGHDDRNVNDLLENMHWGDEGGLQFLHTAMLTYLPGLVHNPMPPFTDPTDDNQPIEYRGYSWWEHAAVCKSILQVVLREPQTALGDPGMHALMTIVSYGMDLSAVFLSPWSLPSQDGSSDIPQLAVEDPVFGVPMHFGRLNLEEATAQDVWSWMHGRRWIVVPVSFGEDMWTMSIFDRQDRQLYVFDSGKPRHRQDRITAVVHLWVQFWNHMHRPFSFQLIVPEVTEHFSDISSWKTCVMWTMLNLRNRVGHVLRRNDRPDDDEQLATPFSLHFGQPDTEFTMRDSSLCLHDWIPNGCPNSASGMVVTECIIKCMLQNELAMESHPLTEGYMHPPDYRSAYDLIQTQIATIGARDEVSKADFWTGQGGLQFAIPAGTSVPPYDPDSTEFDRFHHRQMDENSPDSVGNQWERLSNQAEDLVYPWPAEVHWKRGVRFHEGYTLQAPMPPRIITLKPLRHFETDTSRTYYSNVLNRDPPDWPGRNDHGHLFVHVDNIRHVVHRNNLSRYIRFELGIRHMDQAEVRQTVEIPMPPSVYTFDEQDWLDSDDSDSGYFGNPTRGLGSEVDTESEGGSASSGGRGGRGRGGNDDGGSGDSGKGDDSGHWAHPDGSDGDGGNNALGGGQVEPQDGAQPEAEGGSQTEPQSTPQPEPEGGHVTEPDGGPQPEPEGRPQSEPPSTPQPEPQVEVLLDETLTQARGGDASKSDRNDGGKKRVRADDGHETAAVDETEFPSPKRSRLLEESLAQASGGEASDADRDDGGQKTVRPDDGYGNAAVDETEALSPRRSRLERCARIRKALLE